MVRALRFMWGVTVMPDFSTEPTRNIPDDGGVESDGLLGALVGPSMVS